MKEECWIEISGYRLMAIENVFQKPALLQLAVHIAPKSTRYLPALE
jgi:hypothetical protein